MSYMQKGDTGIQFQVTVTESDEVTPIDVSGADTMQVILGPPTGVRIVKDASSTSSSGADGVFVWTTDLDSETSEPTINLAGTWSIQCYWEKSGDLRHSTVTTFDVYENIE